MKSKNAFIQKILISCSLMLLVLFHTSLWGDINIERVAVWGTGYYRDVSVQGDYAYCAASYGGLDIIDIGSSSNPVRIADYFPSPYSPVNCVYVSGYHAYIGVGSDLHIIEIAIPTLPVKIGECSPTNDYALEDVYVDGNYAYTANGDGFSIIDVSIPNNPRITATYRTHYTSGIYVVGKYAYVTDDYYGYMIVDISNPASPTMVSYNAYPSTELKVTVNGDYAYYAAGQEGVHIFKSDPKRPGTIATYDTSGNAFNVLASGNYVYVADYQKGLKIIDVSQPASPTLTGSFYHSGASWALDKKDSVIYSADFDHGLHLIDVSNPASPTLLGSFDKSCYVRDIIKYGDTAYLIGEESGLRLLDVSNPTFYKQLDYFDTEQRVTAAAVDGDYAFIAEQSVGLRVIDVRNPAAMKQVSICGFDSQARDMADFGNYIYLADGLNGLRIIDKASILLPGQVGSYKSPYASGVAVRPGYIYLADGSEGLLVLDRSNPIKPFIIGRYKVPGNKIAILGHRAFMVHEDFGLYIIDISIPSSPTLVSSYPFQGAMDVEVEGEYVFLTVAYSGLHIINFSNPANPILEASHSLPYYSEGLCKSGNYVYMAQGQSGMSILKVSGLNSTPPYIHLDRDRINAGIQRFGPLTTTRKVFIENTGGSTLKWSTFNAQQWLACSPGSGEGAAMITVYINAEGLSPGTYEGNIKFSDSHASNSPLNLPVTLTVYDSGQTSGPLGYFDTPLEGSVVYGSIPVTGWAIDDIGIDNVKIYRLQGHTSVYIGDADFVEGARPDIQQLYPNYPGNYTAGWGYMLLTNFLPNGGNGTVTLRAIATDKEGNQSILGEKTIICDNANAVKPFGTLDTPLQGGMVSGNTYTNWGWVLTPQPNYIPNDGSTLAVWVDGVKIGRPTYNIYRSDIATLFPDYANSDGGVGYFSMDASSLENGVHTIQWTAADSAGNTDGIGSRYFKIMNSRTSDSKEKNQMNQMKQANPFQLAHIKDIPLETREPVSIQTGYGPSGADDGNDDGNGDDWGGRGPLQVKANRSGVYHMSTRELERIEITIHRGLPVLAGYSLPGGQLGKLPIGSTLDAQRGAFLWQPGPGFRGTYTFLFVYKDKAGGFRKKTVAVEILPKFDLLPPRQRHGHKIE